MSSTKKPSLGYRIGFALRKFRYWSTAQLIFGILALVKKLPPEKASNAVAELVQIVGPLLPRQKIVMSNLSRAFPEKDENELKGIARRMWRNMGRQIAEYVFLDQLFDFHPDNEMPGRIEVVGEDIFRRIHADGKPRIFFTAHTGNFELLPVCAATFGLEVTALFRPPNNPYIAEQVLKARTTNMGGLVPSKAGAAWGLAKAIEDGKSVGVLVDQKFLRGNESTFFGRKVQTNPLLPKLVRQFDLPVHPTRCVRLPGGRFRLELEEEMQIPRDSKGAVDIDATVQLLNDKVESWVREYPDQWMWMHKRWERGFRTPQGTIKRTTD